MLLHRAHGALELVSVQLFKSFCVPVISYAPEAVSPSKSSIYMLDNLINTAVFRIFKCSSMSDIWFIRSMFDLEEVGVMLERRQSNVISRYRCSVSFADVILRYM